MSGKIRAKWERAKAEIKELLPWVAFGTVGGMIVGGWVGAIDNSTKINRLAKRVDRHSELINQHADAGNSLAERTWEDHQKIEEIERRQALLMEQALRNTEGGH